MKRITRYTLLPQNALIQYGTIGLMVLVFPIVGVVGQDPAPQDLILKLKTPSSIDRLTAVIGIHKTVTANNRADRKTNNDLFVSPLVEALDDANAEVRIQSAIALGMIGRPDPQALQKLKSLMQNPNEEMATYWGKAREETQRGCSMCPDPEQRMRMFAASARLQLGMLGEDLPTYKALDRRGRGGALIALVRFAAETLGRFDGDTGHTTSSVQFIHDFFLEATNTRQNRTTALQGLVVLKLVRTALPDPAKALVDAALRRAAEDSDPEIRDSAIRFLSQNVQN